MHLAQFAKGPTKRDVNIIGRTLLPLAGFTNVEYQKAKEDVLKKLTE